jgi:lysophospholipase L1-like esterase
MNRLSTNNIVNQESGMFAGSNEIQLFFPAKKILKITGHSTQIEYENGRDFLHTFGSNKIIRTTNSRIPMFTQEELYPVKNLRLHPHPDANAIDNAINGGYLLFNNRNMFAINQIDITYQKDTTSYNIKIDRQLEKLPLTRNKLKTGKPVNVTIIGDSISEGFNATKFTNIYPFAPIYMEQVCEELSTKFNTKVNLINRAKASTGIQYTQKIEDAYCNDASDLLVIAYGMNNFSTMPIEEFITRLSQILTSVKKTNPNTEFLIVTFMTGHKSWKPTVPGKDTIYAKEMCNFASNQGLDVAVADVQSIWKTFLTKKSFYDLTGNGVNHPNDYGHRIYASTLLEILTGESYF